MKAAELVVAGAESRLIVRAGMTATSRYDVDQMVVAESLALRAELGRAVQGPELYALWLSAHRGYAAAHPTASLGQVAAWQLNAKSLTAAMARASAAITQMKRQFDALSQPYDRPRLQPFIPDTGGAL